MDPRCPHATVAFDGLPRTRGDGPAGLPGCCASASASPHTRGWTRAAWRAAAVRAGFPTHAGMDPTGGPPPRCWTGLPRTRGDGPVTETCARRPGWASPHTRGWTRPDRVRNGAAEGFPAHAGMDPAGSASGPRRAGLPRTRGDGPVARRGAQGPPLASPHTRGWTRGTAHRADRRCGFPAHAGMDPGLLRGVAGVVGLPRTRGDGPYGEDPSVTPVRASPHTRGWTRHWPAATC